jgi:hypothetical protein
MHDSISYKQATAGFVNPAVMMGSGKIFRWAAEQRGEPEPLDRNGNPLLDGEAYLCTVNGLSVEFSILVYEDIP